MRAIHRWLTEYGQSHTHPVNETIHWICVPTIVWTVVALLFCIPVPAQLGEFAVPGLFAYVAVAAALLYYLRLSPLLMLGMLVFASGCLALSATLHARLGGNLGWLALAVFVAAWIGQFIGHKVEGKKPSFLKDVFFLLIGPIWLLAHLYRKWGWRY